MNVAQVGNSAVIAAIGQGGIVSFYWQTIGGGPWNPELVIDPITTNPPVGTRNGKGRFSGGTIQTLMRVLP